MQDDLARSVLETFGRGIDRHFGRKGPQVGLGADAVVDLRRGLDLFDQPCGIVRAERLETPGRRAVVVDRFHGRIDGVAVARLPVDVEDAQRHALLFELFERPRTLASRLGRHVARRREVGPGIPQSDIFAGRAVAHPADRYAGRPGIGECRLHHGGVSGADELHEMFRPHLRRDLARTARGVDRILGQRRGIGDVLDVEPQPRGASLLHHLAEKIFQRGQLFAVGESASRAQFGQRMLPRVHPVDLALAVGMGHDDVVVLRPVDVALRAVASLPDGIAERGQRIVRRLALGRAAAVGDDVIGTRGWLQQAVVDLFVGIGNLAPIGLRGPLVVGAGEKQERGRSQ